MKGSHVIPGAIETLLRGPETQQTPRMRRPHGRPMRLTSQPMVPLPLVCLAEDVEKPLQSGVSRANLTPIPSPPAERGAEG